MTDEPKPEVSEPKKAGRRGEWPTIWHKDQVPFPWGGATRLRKKADRDGALKRALARLRPQ